MATYRYQFTKVLGVSKQEITYFLLTGILCLSTLHYIVFKTCANQDKHSPIPITCTMMELLGLVMYNCKNTIVLVYSVIQECISNVANYSCYFIQEDDCVEFMTCYLRILLTALASINVVLFLKKRYEWKYMRKYPFEYGKKFIESNVQVIECPYCRSYNVRR